MRAYEKLSMGREILTRKMPPTYYVGGELKMISRK